MIAMNSQQLLALFPQEVDVSISFDFSGVETDSRKSCAGALFIALRGEHFDAHDFLQQAQAQGAVAALVERRVAQLEIPQIVVEDTLQAMARLANYWRHQVGTKVIAITGSNGKTTVKEMLGRILQAQAKVLMTPGNFNNAIGVPLTLFGLSPEDRFAVIEMGANHRHEIEQLVAIADPDVVYVNNARAAHLEGFGSVQGVIQAKGEMYQSAGANSIAVFNEDEDAAKYWQSICDSSQTLGFSLHLFADVMATVIARDHGLQIEFEYQQDKALTTLKVAGMHNAQNAAAAITLALACGVDLSAACRALDGFSGVNGRQRFYPGLNDSTIIDDSYNANPDSLAAAVQVLCELDGEAWLALGDMAEMGDESLQLHQQALQAAKKSGVEQVFAFGKMSCSAAQVFDQQGHCFESHDEMADYIAPRLHRSVNLLVKGSRSAQMEKIVSRLRSEPSNQQAAGVHHAV